MSSDHLTLLRILELEMAKTIAPSVTGQVALQIATLSGKLLSRAVVDETLAPELRTGAMQAFRELLPALQAFIPAGQYQGLEQLLNQGGLTEWAALEKQLSAVMDSLIRQGGKATSLAEKLIAIDVNLRNTKEAAYEARIAPKTETDAGFDFGSFGQKQQQALLGYLKAQYPAENQLRIGGVSVVPGGFSKQTVFVDLADNTVLPNQIVLRRDAPFETSGTSVVMEFPVIKRMHEGGVKAPQPFLLEQTGDILGTPFIVVSRIQGRIIGDFLKPGEQCPGFTDDLARQLAQLHSVSFEGLEEVLYGGNMTARQRMAEELDQHIAIWSGLVHYSSFTMQAALGWLKNNLHLAEGPLTIVHRDTALQNILVDNNKVAAFLDWETCAIGTPAEDLGYAYYTVKQLGDWEQFVSAYEQASGVAMDRKQLDYFALWGMVKPGIGIARTADAVKRGENDKLQTLYIGEHFTETLLQRIATLLAGFLKDEG